MSPLLRTRKNQYLGINAHFQSYAQAERDGWATFHTHHLGHLSEAIDRLLPDGYEVSIERSLQVRLYDPESGRVVPRYPAPDITIWASNFTSPRGGGVGVKERAVALPVMRTAVLETMEITHDETLRAIVIKEHLPTGDVLPIARLELLSPTNKMGEEKRKYLAKRDATLEAGTVLVEIDYLHETDSPIRGVTGYASRAEDAYPFTILVSDPRPSPELGETALYGFRVDEPILPIRIPLVNDDSIELDFGAVYDATFGLLSTYSNRVDYSREPIHFDRYTHPDQLKIWGRMLAVVAAKRQGLDLEAGNLTYPADNPVLVELGKGFIEAHLWIDETDWQGYWLIHAALEGQYQWRLCNEQNQTLKSEEGDQITIRIRYEILKEQGLTALLGQGS